MSGYAMLIRPTRLKADNEQDVDREKLYTAIFNAEGKWIKEFAAFGLDRLRINKTQLDNVH